MTRDEALARLITLAAIPSLPIEEHYDEHGVTKRFILPMTPTLSYVAERRRGRHLHKEFFIKTKTRMPSRGHFAWRKLCPPDYRPLSSTYDELVAITRRAFIPATLT